MVSTPAEWQLLLGRRYLRHLHELPLRRVVWCLGGSMHWSVQGHLVPARPSGCVMTQEQSDEEASLSCDRVDNVLLPSMVGMLWHNDDAFRPIDSLSLSASCSNAR